MEPQQNLEPDQLPDSDPTTDPNPLTNPNHATGPITEAGKAVSCMNRLTHGCRSETVILRSEDPAQYLTLIQSWFDQYNPQTPAERILVSQTAHAQWYLQRNQRRFDEVDYHKNLQFHTWTESQNHEYALALRYRTTAERFFLRWFHELEAYYARVQRTERWQAEAALHPPPRHRKTGIASQAESASGPQITNCTHPETAPVKSDQGPSQTPRETPRETRDQTSAIPLEPDTQPQPEPPVYPVLLPHFPTPAEFFFPVESPPRL
jgi:hypothetical protein